MEFRAMVSTPSNYIIWSSPDVLMNSAFRTVFSRNCQLSFSCKPVIWRVKYGLLPGNITYSATITSDGYRSDVQLTKDTSRGPVHWVKFILTHWGRDKMDAIFQTTFSNWYYWMKMYEFRLKFHWSLFLKFQLAIFQHWFRWWLGADQATSHYLNQWWIVYWRIYASLGLSELKAMLVTWLLIG